MGRLDNYEEVKDRLPRFWNRVKNGRIHTKVLGHSENWDRVTFLCELYEGETLIATGTAMDWKGKDNQANKTNWLEVAETSAIGRAIANSRYQDPNAARPSREEMEVAFDRQDAPESPSGPSGPSKSQKPAWIRECELRFGANEGKVNNFFITNKKINAGQTFRSLPQKNQTELLKGLDAFCKGLGI